MKKYENYTKEQLIQKIKQLESKKYGLVWDDEKEPEKVVVECQNNIPILKKIDEKTIKIDIKKPTNILIEGDNYHALQVLNYTHKGQIDVIYIDPPYNTGNKDFKYNDSFVDKEDGYKHSKWLNFMSKRLKLAHNLLNESGVIFVSIDDNEVAQLKLLCDDVFLEKNFVASVIWKRKRGRDNSARWFSKSHEYLLIYAKEKELFNTNFLELEESTKKAYINPDNDYRGNYRMLAVWARGTQGGVKYDFTDKNGNYFEERLWLFSKNNLIKLDNEDKLIIKGKNLYRKLFLSENKGKIPETVWDNTSNAANAADEIKNLFGNIVFDTPKPIPYIQEILKIATKEDSIILDFFAGSGTTGHAILELNKVDGGNRQFILCTNNENSICEEVTYPRISKVINGYTTPKGVAVDGITGNLDYYKTDLIPTNGISNITDSTREELTKKAGNMIAIKENTHFMVELCEHYQIFINETTKKQTAIYFTEDLSCFYELVEKTKSNFTKLYIFSFGKIDRSSYKYLGKNFSIEDIPEPIIEIYKEINKEGIL